ncbi:MAG: exo-alpha-sialidase [Prolixibacteraceae bacterium]|nr:exo-alpha-sialidase [Prolixibacteraceae bacterium]
MKIATKLCLPVILALIFCSFGVQSAQKNISAKVMTAEFIYETAPFPSCHASTIVETNEGLLAAWFGGTHENHPDVCIYTSANIKGKWSAPMQVADGTVHITYTWNRVRIKYVHLKIRK